MKSLAFSAITSSSWNKHTQKPWTEQIFIGHIFYTVCCKYVATFWNLLLSRRDFKPCFQIKWGWGARLCGLSFLSQSMERNETKKALAQIIIGLCPPIHQRPQPFGLSTALRRTCHAGNRILPGTWLCPKIRVTYQSFAQLPSKPSERLSLSLSQSFVNR